MKCLIISPDFPPPFEGGSLVYMHNLVEHYPESVDILAGRIPEGCEEIHYEKHRIIRSRFIPPADGRSHLRAWLNSVHIALLFMLRQFTRRYDMVVVSAGVAGNSFVVLAAKLLRVPVVGIGYAEEITTTQKNNSMKYLLKKILMKFCYPRFDGFVACCDFTRDLVQSVGLAPGKIDVFPVMLSEGRKLNEGCPTKTGRHILSVGRLVVRKGFHYLIEAVNLIKDEIPDVTLTIVGRGPQTEALEQLIRKYKLEKHVFLRGFVTEEELAQLYRESTLFVLAHVMLENGDTEGCPTVFVEASAYGMPVIGGVEGGASSAIEEGVTGYLVNPRDIKALAGKMKTLLLNADLSSQMGGAGIKKVERDHDPRKAGVRLNAFLKGVLESAARRG